MNKIIGIGVIIVLIFISGFALFSNKQTVPESSLLSDNTAITDSETPTGTTTNIKASFAIFTTGTFRIFTAPMYHNLSENVYIEASNPNTIYVKKAGTTWNDFFLTLPMKLTSKCLITGTKQTFCTGNSGILKFYINGVQNNNALSQEIREGDKLLVTFGTESEEVIKKQLNKIP